MICLNLIQLLIMESERGTCSFKRKSRIIHLEDSVRYRCNLQVGMLLQTFQERRNVQRYMTTWPGSDLFLDISILICNHKLAYAASKHPGLIITVNGACMIKHRSMKTYGATN
jgi:hypothetical protein